MEEQGAGGKRVGAMQGVEAQLMRCRLAALCSLICFGDAVRERLNYCLRVRMGFIIIYIPVAAGALF